MRKVTREAVQAFFAGRPYSNNNTAVVVPQGSRLVAFTLHGNVIAVRFIDDPASKFYITDAGWQTVTTKERLNGVLSECGGFISQMNYMWFLNLKDGSHAMAGGDWFAIENGKLAYCAA